MKSPANAQSLCQSNDEVKSGRKRRQSSTSTHAKPKRSKDAVPETPVLPRGGESSSTTTGEDKQMLDLLKEHGLSPAQLKMILASGAWQKNSSSEASTSEVPKTSAVKKHRRESSSSVSSQQLQSVEDTSEMPLRSVKKNQRRESSSSSSQPLPPNPKLEHVKKEVESGSRKKHKQVSIRSSQSQPEESIALLSPLGKGVAENALENIVETKAHGRNLTLGDYSQPVTTVQEPVVECTAAVNNEPKQPSKKYQRTQTSCSGNLAKISTPLPEPVEVKSAESDKVKNITIRNRRTGPYCRATTSQPITPVHVPHPLPPLEPPEVEAAENVEPERLVKRNKRKESTSCSVSQPAVSAAVHEFSEGGVAESDVPKSHAGKEQRDMSASWSASSSVPLSTMPKIAEGDKLKHTASKKQRRASVQSQSVVVSQPASTKMEASGRSEDANVSESLKEVPSRITPEYSLPTAKKSDIRDISKPPESLVKKEKDKKNSKSLICQESASKLLKSPERKGPKKCNSPHKSPSSKLSSRFKSGSESSSVALGIMNMIQSCHAQSMSSKGSSPNQGLPEHSVQLRKLSINVIKLTDSEINTFRRSTQHEKKEELALSSTMSQEDLPSSSVKKLTPAMPQSKKLNYVLNKMKGKADLANDSSTPKLMLKHISTQGITLPIQRNIPPKPARHESAFAVPPAPKAKSAALKVDKQSSNLKSSRPACMTSHTRVRKKTEDEIIKSPPSPTIRSPSPAPAPSPQTPHSPPLSPPEPPIAAQIFNNICLKDDREKDALKSLETPHEELDYEEDYEDNIDDAMSIFADPNMLVNDPDYCLTERASRDDVVVRHTVYASVCTGTGTGTGDEEVEERQDQDLGREMGEMSENDESSSKYGCGSDLEEELSQHDVEDGNLSSSDGGSSSPHKAAVTENFVQLCEPAPELGIMVEDYSSAGKEVPALLGKTPANNSKGKLNEKVSDQVEEQLNYERSTENPHLKSLASEEILPDYSSSEEDDNPCKRSYAKSSSDMSISDEHSESEEEFVLPIKDTCEPESVGEPEEPEMEELLDEDMVAETVSQSSASNEMESQGSQEPHTSSEREVSSPASHTQESQSSENERQLHAHQSQPEHGAPGAAQTHQGRHSAIVPHQAEPSVFETCGSGSDTAQEHQVNSLIEPLSEQSLCPAALSAPAVHHPKSVSTSSSMDQGNVIVKPHSIQLLPSQPAQTSQAQKYRDQHMVSKVSTSIECDLLTSSMKKNDVVSHNTLTSVSTSSIVHPTVQRLSNSSHKVTSVGLVQRVDNVQRDLLREQDRKKRTKESDNEFANVHFDPPRKRFSQDNAYGVMKEPFYNLIPLPPALAASAPTPTPPPSTGATPSSTPPVLHVPHVAGRGLLQTPEHKPQQVPISHTPNHLSSNLMPLIQPHFQPQLSHVPNANYPFSHDIPVSVPAEHYTFGQSTTRIQAFQPPPATHHFIPQQHLEFRTQNQMQIQPHSLAQHPPSAQHSFHVQQYGSFPVDRNLNPMGDADMRVGQYETQIYTRQDNGSCGPREPDNRNCRPREQDSGSCGPREQDNRNCRLREQDNRNCRPTEQDNRNSRQRDSEHSVNLGLRTFQGSSVPFCSQYLKTGKCQLKGCNYLKKLPQVEYPRDPVKMIPKFEYLQPSTKVVRKWIEILDQYPYWVDRELDSLIGFFGHNNVVDACKDLVTFLWNRQHAFCHERNVGNQDGKHWVQLTKAFVDCGYSLHLAMATILGAIARHKDTEQRLAVVDHIVESLFSEFSNQCERIWPAIKPLISIKNYELPIPVMVEALQHSKSIHSTMDHLDMYNYIIANITSLRDDKEGDLQLSRLIHQFADLLRRNPKCSDYAKRLEQLHPLPRGDNCSLIENPSVRAADGQQSGSSSLVKSLSIKEDQNKINLEVDPTNQENKGIGKRVTKSVRIKEPDNVATTLKIQVHENKRVVRRTDPVLLPPVKSSKNSPMVSMVPRAGILKKTSFEPVVAAAVVEPTAKPAPATVAPVKQPIADGRGDRMKLRSRSIHELLQNEKFGAASSLMKNWGRTCDIDGCFSIVFDSLKKSSDKADCQTVNRYKLLWQAINADGRKNPTLEKIMARVGFYIINDLSQNQDWEEAYKFYLHLTTGGRDLLLGECTKFTKSGIYIKIADILRHLKDFEGSFRMLTEKKLICHVSDWALTHDSDDVMKRDRLCFELFRDCLSDVKFVCLAESIFLEMMKFKDSYTTFDMSSFLDRMLRAYLKCNDTDKAVKLLTWAENEFSIQPNVNTSRVLLLAINDILRGKNFLYTPAVILLLDSPPYKNAICVKDPSTVIVTLESSWFTAEVDAILMFLLKYHLIERPVADLPEIILVIKESSIPERDGDDFPSGLCAIDTSWKAMWLRIQKSLIELKLKCDRELPELPEHLIVLNSDFVKQFIDTIKSSQVPFRSAVPPPLPPNPARGVKTGEIQTSLQANHGQVVQTAKAQFSLLQNPESSFRTEEHSLPKDPSFGTSEEEVHGSCPAMDPSGGLAASQLFPPAEEVHHPYPARDRSDGSAASHPPLLAGEVHQPHCARDRSRGLASHPPFPGEPSPMRMRFSAVHVTPPLPPPHFFRRPWGPYQWTNPGMEVRAQYPLPRRGRGHPRGMRANFRRGAPI